jgi:hypothetical protein
MRLVWAKTPVGLPYVSFGLFIVKLANVVNQYYQDSLAEANFQGNEAFEAEGAG